MSETNAQEELQNDPMTGEGVAVAGSNDRHDDWAATAADLLQQLSPEAHDRLGSVLESVVSQVQGRNVNITYANRKDGARISKYATALHTFLTTFDNEVRNQNG